uniref:rRNA biogenesis protein rrp5 n=1 Tax=Candidatus Fimivicinus sp. TaxID=3056640 RepID=UPI003FEDC489
MSKVKLLLNVTSDLRSLADSVQAVADAMMQNEPTVDAEPKAEVPALAPKKEISMEEVRAILGEKSHNGFTEEIRALLLKYGAPKLSGIDPKYYEALLKDVEVLKDAT